MGPLDRLDREFFEALNAGDLEAVRAALDPSCDFAAPGFTGQGPDAAIGWMRPFLAAFPGIHHEVLGTVEAQDAVAFELDIAGTHTAARGAGRRDPRDGTRRPDRGRQLLARQRRAHHRLPHLLRPDGLHGPAWPRPRRAR